MAIKTLATATYRDTYCGDMAVRLVPVGRNGLAQWVGVERAATCGYRNAPANRLLHHAEHDRRFSNIVREG